MKEENLISVNMKLAGRFFPVRVTQEEEPFVRDIEVDLNNKISNFQKHYPSRDLADHVLMTLLTVVYEQISEKSTQQQSLKEKVQELKQILT